MTDRPPPQCVTCIRWAGPMKQKCIAFPTGIPDDIWNNYADHRQPFKGDHGLQWATDGKPFPEVLLMPKRK